MPSDPRSTMFDTIRSNIDDARHFPIENRQCSTPSDRKSTMFDTIQAKIDDVRRHPIENRRCSTLSHRKSAMFDAFQSNYGDVRRLRIENRRCSTSSDRKSERKTAKSAKKICARVGCAVRKVKNNASIDLPAKRRNAKGNIVARRYRLAGSRLCCGIPAF